MPHGMERIPGWISDMAVAAGDVMGIMWHPAYERFTLDLAWRSIRLALF